jgi:hypothetical protein
MKVHTGFVATCYDFPYGIKVVAAERWRGLGYLLVAALLVGSGIAAISWKVVRRRPRGARRVDQPGDATSSPAG